MKFRSEIVAVAVTIAVLLIAGFAADAGAGDEFPPSNEGVCDELKYGTPGLYGLCVAFCEAQDCEPDLSAGDPFEGCVPGSPRVLANYRKKMKDGDPDMPCIKAPCPCWSEEELAVLRFPQPGDDVACQLEEFPDPGTEAIDAFWITGGRSNRTTLYVKSGGGEFRCAFIDLCGKFESCLRVRRLVGDLTVEEYASCQGDVRSAGMERGIECFLD